MTSGGGDSGAAAGVSVVPLLQERFRQLQKMKELRQEKQLLRMFYTNTCSTPPPPAAAASGGGCGGGLLLLPENYFSGHQLQVFLNPPKPHCQLSLSLWPGEDCRPRAGRASSASSLSKSWFSDQNSDIDTSLHL